MAFKRTPVKIDECKVGDVVTYYVASSKTDKRTAVGRIGTVDAANNRVSIGRRVGNNVYRITVPPARIVGFHPPGMPF